MIAVFGFVESIAIAKTYSSKHNYSVSANRELVALGIANIFGGLFQGIPAYGSVSINKKVIKGRENLILFFKKKNLKIDISQQDQR
jgi:hypothetical protein